MIEDLWLEIGDWRGSLRIRRMTRNFLLERNYQNKPWLFSKGYEISNETCKRLIFKGIRYFVKKTCSKAWFHVSNFVEIVVILPCICGKNTLRNSTFEINKSTLDAVKRKWTTQRAAAKRKWTTQRAAAKRKWKNRKGKPKEYYKPQNTKWYEHRFYLQRDPSAARDVAQGTPGIVSRQGWD